MLSPTVLAQLAFESSIDNIDNYYSCGDNYCQDIIVDVLSKKYNQYFHRQQITIGNNATSLISFFVQNLLAMGISNYLAIAPIYFSAVDAIHLGHGSITIMQPELPNLSIDLFQLEETIRKNNIQAVIVTDPFFAFGKDVDMNQFEQIVQICRNCCCTIICDFARYGLEWESENEHSLFNEKIRIFDDTDRFALIYSPCKQLFANGIKTAIMVTSRNFTRTISDYSDSVLGSISAAQLAFLNFILAPQNQSDISSSIKRNLTHIKANYNKIQSFILGSNIISYPPDMGNYMVLGIPKTENDYEMFQNILKHCNISTLPLSLYHFYNGERYFFRTNLSLAPTHLLNSVLAIEEFIECTQQAN